MTSHDDTVPATTGLPAWVISCLQGLVLVAATIVCFRATNHQHQWVLAAIAAAALGWAIAKPDSPATTVWILIVGSWWLTGFNTPTLGTTLQASLLVLTGHNLTAMRASLHRTTRLSLGYLATCLAALTALMLGTASALPLISLIADSPLTSEQWTSVWTTAAVAVLAGLSAWFTKARTQPRANQTGSSQTRA